MDRDSEIDAALLAEERALLDRIPAEPGYFHQLGLLFSGEAAWVNLVMMVSQLLLFAAGSYAAWHFFGTENVMEALRWGLPSAVLLIMSLMIKLALWPVVQTNRLLRAVKHLEIEILDRTNARR
ncbi:MAG TPA: hypothetical protein PKD99_01380 [Sphingopyxis sp.]|nr:hypothetical protein [Sphingopyxis sp.]HMP43727.1 hypothetical protein [Sphingopyxis sp.]